MADGPGGRRPATGRIHLLSVNEIKAYTNDHFLADTTKHEKWLVLVGRPSLADSRWRARRPAPPSSFHIKTAIAQVIYLP
jgi:hypothetical protein